MIFQVKKLSEHGVIPTKGSEFAAGYDLYSVEDYLLNSGERKLFKTNIAVKIQDGYFGQICGRSGLAYKKGISVLGGIIDSDFLGDIGVILLNTNVKHETSGSFNVFDLGREDRVNTINSNNSLSISKGDRIAQIVFKKHENVEFVEVDQLVETNRGETGFGASGK